MRGQAFTYFGIMIVLILTSLALLRVNWGINIERSIITIEGKIVSFENYVELLIKTLNQSVEFNAQRSAYELGKTGGIEGSQIYWTSSYPKLDVLERGLEDKIRDSLPSSSYTKDTKKIIWGEGVIDVNDYDIVPCGPIESSKCFVVEGSKYLAVYDKGIDSRISVNQEIDSDVNSNYFKLLNAGRAIMEDSQFNQYLNDTGALLNELYNAKANDDSRLSNLDFSADVNENVVTITIEEICFPPDIYCLAPLYPGETGIIDPATGNQIPYDYVRLKFQYEEEQTGTTPSVFNFNVEVSPDVGSIESGESIETFVTVNRLSSEVKPVDLDYTINPDPATISVTFETDNENPTFTSKMTVTTTTMTLAGIYIITITGIGDGLTRSAAYTLTVDPSMFFSLDVDPISETIDIAETTTVDVTVTFISGNPSPIVLDEINNPPGIATSFNLNNQNPDYISTLTITENGAGPGTYPLRIRGIGGGSTEYVDYTLTVAPPFEFEIILSSTSGTMIPDETTIVPIDVNYIQGISKQVQLSHTVASIIRDPGNDPGLVSVSFNPDNGIPSFPSDMTIETTSDRTADQYAIVVKGEGGGWSDEKTYELTVIVPRCFDDADCDDSNDCTGVIDEGKIDKCRDAGTINAWCERPNLPVGTLPNNNACGTNSTECPDKCDAGNEYRDGDTKTCDRACDGTGNPPLGGCQPCSPDLGSCTNADYGTVDSCGTDSDTCPDKCEDENEYRDGDTVTCDIQCADEVYCGTSCTPDLSVCTNADYGTVDSCGTVSETCPDKCDAGNEYRDGDTKTCDIQCADEVDCGTSCSPDSCTASDYTNEWECRYSCSSDDVNCVGGEWCPSETFDPLEVCPVCCGSSCTTPATCISETDSAPSCTSDRVNRFPPDGIWNICWGWPGWWLESVVCCRYDDRPTATTCSDHLGCKYSECDDFAEALGYKGFCTTAIVCQGDPFYGMFYTEPDLGCTYGCCVY